jgi:hypothetical protein
MYIKTNALIRRLDDQLHSKKDDRQRHQHQTILTLSKLNEKIKQDLSITAKLFEMIEKKMFVSKKKKLQIIQEIHNQSVIKHSKIKRTLNLIKRFFY